ncbi:Cyclic di-GMP phosphodiesterase Gmr [Aliiroseovarius sp. xm-m-379]|uniref:putative bifunctional diguanylate cyclase/phosphodiesterase n=2 Tax=unclassified Aliiroseovarius TaxID=2623558 RepID=UPI0019E16859|nr:MULTISPECIES: GGDEF domain-containing phosphodiesterase [unclassified Aliiroseovarius]NRP24332.1 Cyclic di-GMP phosphodiesterase Gmr [Aliiroseovarius sp. xm-m-379]NRP29856.1 Cyclic di-GMP phosphodiesterase Gmr [Aliiroseovarius sp. xm-m-314]NRP33131.1 Cyclic di-GMP phosphodiesterase Gmr [Aliiroseovarius sp. xm-a-104]NRP43430.1 Cyclic di-GMP phosphodiesterase Gmr [Aliiroseovarius sp. xm-m-378]NRP49424.1 Cyclic di-GMP phosphodiesterase Gmr [Aliiroseovarius sp. xm-m-354]NRP60874.1 Cyclic di-GM
MAASGNSNWFHNVKQAARAAMLGPQLAAFLPAVALGAFWFGGEGLLVLFAVIFPSLLILMGIVTQPAPSVNAGPTDTITNLPVRDRLIKSLDHALSNENIPDKACVVVEVDDFDNARKNLGDALAERLLQACSERIVGVLRSTDMLAYLGNARFGMCLDKSRRVDLETLIQLSGRLQAAFDTPFLIENVQVHCTLSVGFALPSRAPKRSGESILNAAESALQEAIFSGPGSIRAFTKGDRARVAGSEHSVKEILTALNEGQIVPWFQPQLSTDTGELSGFEALARWNHPDKGLIAPCAFLPALVQAGLSERLGEVMLYHSLTALKDWDKLGIRVPSISVNFSADELRNPRLFEKVKWELDRFDLEPSRLTVEILETVVAQTDDDITSHNIASFSKLGCGVDLDDFGTGHASISSIRRFDVSRIKIDRSFVTHVDTDRDQQSMIAAILTMSERLGLEAIAEGVETHGEHAMLAQLGCAHVQGYSIAKPMPFDATIGWLQTLEEKVAASTILPKRA